MFKNWKQAETRALELSEEIKNLDVKIKEVRSKAENTEISPEERQKHIDILTSDVDNFKKLNSEFDRTISTRDELKSKEDNQFGLISQIQLPKIEARQARSGDAEDVLSTRSYELAFARYVKTKDATEVRALTNTIVSDNAGVLVPTTLANRIADKAKIGGRLLQLCSMTELKGLAEYPVIEQKSDPDWHVEGSTVAGTDIKKEKTLKIVSVPMGADYLAEMLHTTKKFENDSIEAFWEWLMAEFPDALLRQIDAAILTGPEDGTKGIRGVLTNTNPQFVETLAGHTLNFNTANAAAALLDDGVESGPVTIVMNRKTFFNNVMGLIDTTNRPIWSEVASSNLNRPSFVMGGYPVVFSNVLPAYDTATAGQAYMVMGNFNAMRLNFPVGMSPEFSRDETTLKDKNLVRYVSEIYVGGNIVSVGSFVKVTK